eukprot:CAMPEP_0196765534 /NCGR_PEP_ID=MMETSP1095-20130614/9517_1 /TAXON_ID=96789 ORGANISM="Chromulina nebulosa, Strain UTEXLB2642" /NCGR_SAMPLE_ID=MMETSP1095 /ASSEMBLY_ACC=CAM_ASM_000446 /LENGTH=405 /DNA_ID=CAMNT_0042123769 /DNA_START=200 /DNA_END=1417 /DNA_ORIENTATION=-
MSLVNDNYDIRVAKAIGSRGYDKIRLSVISNQTIDSDLFDYSEQFKHRWTDKYLNTGIVTITPGVVNTISITKDSSIDVYIPNEGDGIRGVIIADPCFQSQWITCAYKDKFDMFDHLTSLLNAINSHDDVHFWQILGDNFYDQQGAASSAWFAALTTETKSKVINSVPGNHDYWVNGSPLLRVSKDSLGNGFMQFYGQDVIASTQLDTPYDFSINPDESSSRSGSITAASNFFSYNKLGNIAFIGYSGAYDFTELSSYFVEACEWADSNEDIDVILLLGHWNSDGDGCPSDATVPITYQQLQSLSSCSSSISKMRYFMGHEHCNMITEPDIGFMVGAQGMSDTKCSGQFGIPVVDSTNGTFNVYYFPINELNSFDNYDETLACFQEKGVSGCYDLATLWSTTPLV